MTRRGTAGRRGLGRRLGTLRRLTEWTALGLVAAVVLLATGGQFERVQVMTVLSGSMRPALDVGDLVVAEVVTAQELRTDDVTSFRDPESGKLITHRVQSVLWRGEIADVITRGDANEVGEGWSIRADGTVGRVVLRVPVLGYLSGVLGTDAGQIGLVVTAALLGLWAMVLIWRPAPTTDRSRPSGPPRHRAPRGRWGPHRLDRPAAAAGHG